MSPFKSKLSKSPSLKCNDAIFVFEEHKSCLFISPPSIHVNDMVYASIFLIFLYNSQSASISKLSAMKLKRGQKRRAKSWADVLFFGGLLEPWIYSIFIDVADKLLYDPFSRDCRNLWQTFLVLYLLNFLTLESPIHGTQCSQGWKVVL